MLLLNIKNYMEKMMLTKELHYDKIVFVLDNWDKFILQIKRENGINNRAMDRLWSDTFKNGRSSIKLEDTYANNVLYYASFVGKDSGNEFYSLPLSNEIIDFMLKNNKMTPLTIKGLLKSTLAEMAINEL